MSTLPTFAELVEGQTWDENRQIQILFDFIESRELGKELRQFGLEIADNENNQLVRVPLVPGTIAFRIIQAAQGLWDTSEDVDWREHEYLRGQLETILDTCGTDIFVGIEDWESESLKDALAKIILGEKIR